MAPPRSPAPGARVCGAGSGQGGAQLVRGVTAPRRFMERPTPPARGGRLIGCRTGGREGGLEGRARVRVTPPRPPPLREPGHPPPGHRAVRSPPPRLSLEELPEAPPGPRKSQGPDSGRGQGDGTRGPQRPAASPKSGEVARGTCSPRPAAALRTRPTSVHAPRSGMSVRPPGPCRPVWGRSAPRRCPRASA
ncbi:uncharacterized protein [Manis javanica]|uniref:uncharacterized protein n=1 Tax=Manis javanica TaxID=9974 RepID=UPI003C6D33F2